MSVSTDGAGHDPEIVVLFCQHSVGKTVGLANSYRSLPGLRVRLVVMPCSSKVEVREILKMLENGAYGIQIVACPEQACRFLVGSNRAERRVAYVRRLLDEIDFGPERVGIVRTMNLSGEQLLALAKERADLIRGQGPTPIQEQGRSVRPESPTQAA